MDANFRAQQKIKMGDTSDFHLHPGAAYFRDDEKYREYLSNVMDDFEVGLVLNSLFPANS